MRIALRTPSAAAPRRRRAHDDSGSYVRDDEHAGSRLSDRLREVLERDRALRESAPRLDDLTVSEPPAVDALRDQVSAEIAAWIEAELGPLGPDGAPGESVQDPEPPVPDVEQEDELESEVTNPACTEPIRTVTMARLLALQGYAPRALSIYMELLRHSPNDESLARESAALRARILADQEPLAQVSSR